jgi:hypothetical protein
MSLATIGVPHAIASIQGQTEPFTLRWLQHERRAPILWRPGPGDSRNGSTTNPIGDLEVGRQLASAPNVNGAADAEAAASL